MEVVGFLLFTALGAGVAFWLNMHERVRRKRQREVGEASAEIRLEESGGEPASTVGPPEVDFVRGLATYHLGCDVTLSREGFDTDLLKQSGSREIEIGDAAFDREFFLQGPSPLVRAVLDAETRQLVRRLSHVEIVAGTLRASIRDGDAGPKGESTMQAVAKLAERLACPGDLAPLLAHNAQRDPEPRVRLQNLLTLAREFPQDTATGQALRAACTDESDEIRLRAAMALGEEGHKVLLEMAAGGELGRSVDDQWSAGAIAALGEHLPRERAQAILEGALMARRPRTARECVRALGRIGGTEVIEPLARALFTATGEVAAEVARALGATGLSRAEPSLLAALERGLPEQRIPVVEALGRIGTVGAVIALNEAVAHHPNDAALRRARRQAIAEIQSRLSGASPGQLSLAAGQGAAGQLSLSDAEAGRLSLAEGDAKRPSPPKDGGTER